ncbi:MAG: hypothetical protein N3D73_01975 [Candidatus Diapherotrites archaeon]|nr:hypothetical protein [Candidatus Diapherotrites archaeon]
MVIKNRPRIIDAVMRLFGEKKEEREIENMLSDVGLTKEETKEVIKEAKERYKDDLVDKETKLFEKKEPGNIEQKTIKFREVLPTRVSNFDKLITNGGLKRGDTILLSGGCGTGKTTFSMQSLYYGALNNEKGVYITLEESPEKMKENHLQNFGWDLEALEREGKLAIIKIDPLTIARAVEAMLTKERGGLYIDIKEFELPFKLNLPFKPDRVVIDSLSALSIAFMENEQAYRQYLRSLFESLESYNSVNIVLGETEQEPGIYSRSGIEEFLADGVVVFYNIKMHNVRQKALEILKLRSSNHEKRIVPYKITQNGVEIFIDEEMFSE